MSPVHRNMVLQLTAAGGRRIPSGDVATASKWPGAGFPESRRIYICTEKIYQQRPKKLRHNREGSAARMTNEIKFDES